MVLRSPSTELAAGPADVCQKPRMVVAIFDGDAVTDAMAVCSRVPTPPELAPPSSAAAAAGPPAWSAVAYVVVASVSTLTERRLGSHTQSRGPPPAPRPRERSFNDKCPTSS